MKESIQNILVRIFWSLCPRISLKGGFENIPVGLILLGCFLFWPNIFTLILLFMYYFVLIFA
jgi:hypothetical protein